MSGALLMVHENLSQINLILAVPITARKGRVGEGTEGRTTEEARKGGTEGPRVLAGWPRRERRGSENDIADIAATRYEQRDLH